MQSQQRYIRLKDAPAYLGMDRNRFKQLVRPALIEIPIGKQGIAFDRLDLDAWADHYKQCNGRPVSEKGRLLWDVKEHQGLGKLGTFGISTKPSTDDDFAKAVAQVSLKKRKDI